MQQKLINIYNENLTLKNEINKFKDKEKKDG